MSNNDLIQDVENAMRQERTEQMWREYGPYILGGALLAVILTAGISGYRAWDDSVNRGNTGQLLQAMESKDEVAALRAAEGGLRPGQKMLARFTVAGALLKDGKNDEALKEYQGIAADTALPAMYRDLGLWLSVRLDWSLHHDKTKAKALADALQPLIAENANPWNSHARIEAAQITARGLGDYKKARDLLAPVMADQTLPDSERQRAEALDHVYALQAGADKGKTAVKEDDSE